MIANFACPFCQAMLQMDASHAGAQVRCPACGQAFQLGALPEPEIPTATLVQPKAASPPQQQQHRSQPQPSHPQQPQRPTGRPPQQAHTPHPQARHPGPQRPGQPQYRHPTAEDTAREETKAKLMLAGIVVGAIVLIGVAVHFCIKYVEHVEGEASGLKEMARMDAAREKEAIREELAAQEKAEKAKEAKRTELRNFLSLQFCGGDDTVAGELLTAMEKVYDEAVEAFNSGQLPSDLPGFMEQSLIKKITASPVLRKFFGSRSAEDFAKTFYGSMERRRGNEGQGQTLGLLANYSSMGSGFFVSSDGWLLTNHHVVDNVTEVDIRTASGEILKAHVMKTDPKADLALLKTSGAAPEWLPLSDGQATLGASVFTVGYPRPTLQGVEPKFTDGTVSSLKGARDEASSYQISVPVQPGNSGGALVHLQSGWVIGVVRSAFDPSEAQNVNYAVKSTVARALIESTTAAKALLKVPVPANPADASTTIEKVKSATVLVLIPR
ncbi:trypsin-like peptidase [Roseimicrobium gellanilyticum]|uniref:Trypsin-like peptidase n=1 Tax=Roseimicrobium gellanilyticum TaxID=748857 RepID=A0A366HBW0_9BACT|nr:serine protease [Roseimicrobium gellanilyticum]RBP39013.1 trypsin-like peptidase [Roseimicrobium gellanilyticum]